MGAQIDSRVEAPDKPCFDHKTMRVVVRLLMIFGPIVFLVGLWLGLNKPGWGPKPWAKSPLPIKILCPQGIFSDRLIEDLRMNASLRLQVPVVDSMESYFRLLFQGLEDFDVVCLFSHHTTPKFLEERFDPLPISPEWLARRLHKDFQSLPLEPTPERFWPWGWRILLPVVSKENQAQFELEPSGFHMVLEEDFREVINLHSELGVLRDDWLSPDHTDPMTSTLARRRAQWEEVPPGHILARMEGAARDQKTMFYLSHSHWSSLAPEAAEHWTWGSANFRGSLQVLGLAQTLDSRNPKAFEDLLRALSLVPRAQGWSTSTLWASTLSGVEKPAFLSPFFLRSISLTSYKVTTGLEPSSIFWDRVVHSARSEIEESPEAESFDP